MRFDLLKSTYRIDRETQPQLYTTAERAASVLNLDVPITIYQAQNPDSSNASLAYLSDEAHIVLHGPITSKLKDDEVLALFGHELSHLLLWREWDREFLIVDQILSALTNDRNAQPCHFASMRLFRLYTEIFCDRGSLTVVDDPLVVASTLVKVETGLDEVSGESYIRQADEIFSRQKATTDGLTHPEAFIRARAVKLRADQDADADSKIKQMIEGAPVIDELDLLSQQQVMLLTRRVIDQLIVWEWFQSESVLAHAKLYFNDFEPSGKSDPTLAKDLKIEHSSMRDYYCFVLLDFVTTDRELEELPLAAALILSEQLGFKDRFCELARRELRLRKKQLEKIDKEKEKLAQSREDAKT